MPPGLLTPKTAKTEKLERDQTGDGGSEGGWVGRLIQVHDAPVVHLWLADLDHGTLTTH